MNEIDICVVMDIFQEKNEIEVYSPLLDKNFNVPAKDNLIADLLENEYVAVEVDLNRKTLVT